MEKPHLGTVPDKAVAVHGQTPHQGFWICLQFLSRLNQRQAHINIVIPDEPPNVLGRIRGSHAR